MMMAAATARRMKREKPGDCRCAVGSVTVRAKARNCGDGWAAAIGERQLSDGGFELANIGGQR